MGENESLIRSLLNGVRDIELRTTAGKVNYGFGLLLGTLFVLVFAASLIEKVAEVILAFFKVESPWNAWVTIVALALLIFYFLLSVLIVAYFENRPLMGSSERQHGS